MKTVKKVKKVNKKVKKIVLPELVSVTYKELERELYDQFKTVCEKNGHKTKHILGMIIRKGITAEIEADKKRGA